MKGIEYPVGDETCLPYHSISTLYVVCAEEIGCVPLNFFESESSCVSAILRGGL
jgi:hypothetical protein